MSRSSLLRALRLSAIAPLLAAATLATAATLDLEADAVLGKPNLTTGFVGGASATNVLNPIALAEDPVSGELWVADAGAHRVLRFASAAAFSAGEAANLVLGQADFTTSLPNRAGSPSARTLSLPAGLAVDQAGRLYVSDFGNNRILVYRPPFASGMDASEVVGQPDYTSTLVNRGGGPGSQTLSGPQGIALDAVGNLWVADRNNHRVMRFPAPVATGATANRLYGQASYSTNIGSTTATGLQSPAGVAIDSADNLWVADEQNNRVLRFDLGALSGDNAADLVLCQSTFTSPTAGSTASTCLSPNNVTVERGGGAVYVADSGNSRVLRFTTLSNGAAATAVAGQVNLTAVQCNRGSVSPGPSTLCLPYAVVMARNGDLLVGDYDNGRVLRFDLPRTRPAPVIASISPEAVPQGGGALTVTVNGSRFHSSSVVNWNGVPLATQFLSDRRLVAQVPAANIASAGPFAITVTTPAPGGGTSSLANLSTYARAALDGAADRVLGQPNFTSSTPTNPQVGEEQVGVLNASVLALNSAIAAAVDPATGRLFIADYFRNRVLSWPNATSFQNAQPADVVIGQPDGFSSACATARTAATLCGPYGLGIDAAGALYVADTLSHRVLRFSPPFSTGMSANRVFGQGGSFTTGLANNGGVSANSLNLPRALAVAPGKLFVVDGGNRRLLIYDNPEADFTADVVIGQPNMTVGGVPVVGSGTLSGADGALAVDADGRLYVADMSWNRVIRFSPPFTNAMAADLLLGQPDFLSVSPLATSATAVRSPGGIAFDPAGNLLVSEYFGHRVVRFLAPFTSGMAASDVVGQAGFTSATAGTTTSNFQNPTGIATDRVGNLYVADYGNARVLAFDRPFAFALDPAKDLDGDGIPNGVEVTESRDPYVKDNDVFANARLFAMQQYRDFLSREGDPAGISGWTSLVTGGAYSRLQVIDAFLLSDEFAGVIAPVVRLYFATFLRVPDYAGLTFNAGLVRNGTVTLTQLADFFTASPEFQATYGSLTNTQFVTLLYSNVLGRAPDPDGLNGWVALLNGGMSRGQVLVGFSDSAEYKANMANEVFVTMMYAGMLRRSPEPTGFNGWVAFLDAGTYTREQVINGFFLSTEYRNRFLP